MESARVDPERRRIDARGSALRARARPRQPASPRERIAASDAGRRVDDEPLAARAEGLLQMFEMLRDVLLPDGDPFRELTCRRRPAQQLLANGLANRAGAFHASAAVRYQHLAVGLRDHLAALILAARPHGDDAAAVLRFLHSLN